MNRYKWCLETLVYHWSIFAKVHLSLVYYRSIFENLYLTLIDTNRYKSIQIDINRYKSLGNIISNLFIHGRNNR